MFDFHSTVAGKPTGLTGVTGKHLPQLGTQYRRVKPTRSSRRRCTRHHRRQLRVDGLLQRLDGHREDGLCVHGKRRPELDGGIEAGKIDLNTPGITLGERKRREVNDSIQRRILLVPGERDGRAQHDIGGIGLQVDCHEDIRMSDTR